MANKQLFTSPNHANQVNEAGGKAYLSTNKSSLASMAGTNTVGGTFYASAEMNLKDLLTVLDGLKGNPQYIAQCAVYSRNHCYLKDFPAILCVYLAEIDPSPTKELFHKVFDYVIDNGKMLRNFVQIARSSTVIERKMNMSSGCCRSAINRWFKNKTADQIFYQSIGNDPSIKDVIKMARPNPDSEEKATLFAYLNGTKEERGKFKVYKKTDNGEGKKYLAYEHKFASLPKIVQQYEEYKILKEGEVPKVDFRMLDSLGLDQKQWTEVAMNANWHATRMNIATFARHGVFTDKKAVKAVAERLQNRDLVLRAKVFPYQLLMAYKMTEDNASVPYEVKEALQEAMEIATENVPDINGKIFVLVDSSGSMGSPITGNRGAATTKVSCIDVAGLIASTILRKNKQTEIVLFDTNVYPTNLNPRDSIMTNAAKLSKGGGGTNCAIALRYLNSEMKEGDLVVYVSDQESWVDTGTHRKDGHTAVMTEWQIFKNRNPQARLACFDLTPRRTAQVIDNKDILQVGGMADTIFDILGSFLEYGNNANHLVKEIEGIEL